VKIIAADDHALIREGLHAILKRMDEQLQFIEACDGKSLEAQLAQHPDADLLLLDVQLPDVSGLTLLETLSGQYPDLPIVILSAEHDRETVTRAIDLGAAGFLPKTSLNQVLVSAIQLVMSGGIYIPPEALRPSSAPVPAPAPAPVAPAPGTALTPESLGLTGRQLDVLWLLLEGMSNKQICRKLDLAEATVKVHVRAILRALNVDSRTEAVVVATRMGLVPPAPVAAPGLHG
jgi:DNA-binding NarL/FixJ family response regulator